MKRQGIALSLDSRHGWAWIAEVTVSGVVSGWPFLRSPLRYYLLLASVDDCYCGCCLRRGDWETGSRASRIPI
jgi:hypothetical protein